MGTREDFESFVKKNWFGIIGNGDVVFSGFKKVAENFAADATIWPQERISTSFEWAGKFVGAEIDMRFFVVLYSGVRAIVPPGLGIDFPFPPPPITGITAMDRILRGMPRRTIAEARQYLINHKKELKRARNTSAPDRKKPSREARNQIDLCMVKMLKTETNIATDFRPDVKNRGPSTFKQLFGYLENPTKGKGMTP